MAFNDPKIEEKIKKLKEYWYDDDYSLRFVDEIEKKINRLVVAEELAQNKAIIAIVEDAKKRISVINLLLTIKEDMTTDERKLLIREKKVHQFYLDRFDGKDLDKKFEQVDTLLDAELKKIYG